jgi:hypothetical protein
MQRTLLALAFGLAAGCGNHAGPAGPTYDSIELFPATATLAVPLGGTAAQPYQVFGVAGAVKTDITATCALAIDPLFGTATGALVTVGPHGGKTTVTATCVDSTSTTPPTATAQLAINLTGTIIAPGTPPDAPALFGAATLTTDPTRTPALEYPLDRAVTPRNLPPIETQWTAAGNDLFHLTLVASFATVEVYTTDVQATLAGADWDQLTATASGATLAFKVEALLQAAPTTKYASPAIAIAVSRDTINKTAIYYWASSQGSIMNEAFGSATAPTVVKDSCTSCHSLSRSGTRLGYSRCVANDCGQIFVGFLKYDKTTASWQEQINADNKALSGSYTSFAPVGNPYPDDSQAVAIVTRNGGTMSLYDPDTLAEQPSNLPDVSTHGPGAPRAALMPDWSPDGHTVAFVSSPHPGQWIDLSDGAIATMSYTYANNTHTFGEPDLLVSQPITLPTGTYTNFFFPSFSPDNKLLVFNAARAGWRNGADARAPGQRLMLADVASRAVVDLADLNGPADADITWPHWAPGDSSDFYWVVFATERDYGHEITATKTAPKCIANGVRQCKQIWIGAISKAKLAAGLLVDPSAPPMWLPGQDPGADNISPFWTVPAVIN